MKKHNKNAIVWKKTWTKGLLQVYRKIKITTIYKIYTHKQNFVFLLLVFKKTKRKNEKESFQINHIQIVSKTKKGKKRNELSKNIL